MITLDLKEILKLIKLNERNIWYGVGVLAVLIGSILLYKSVSRTGDTGQTIPSVSTTDDLESQGRVHTVVAGESLWAISERYFASGFKWNDIAKENNLAAPSKIAIGQKLTIPEVPSEGLIGSQKKAVETISGNSYTVAKGDNLWNISVRAYGDGFKWPEIARTNKLVNPNLIHPGNVLNLSR